MKMEESMSQPDPERQICRSVADSLNRAMLLGIGESFVQDSCAGR
jgi:hypothetical protein